MKQLTYIFSLIMAMFLVGCELEPVVQIAENPVGAELLVPASGQVYNYTWDNDQEQVHFVLSPADYGYKAQVTNTIQIDVRGGDFERARTLVFGSTDTLSILVADFNNQVKKLKFKEGETAELDMRVSSSVSDFYDDIISALVPVTYTVYGKPVVEEPEEEDPEEPGVEDPVVSELYMIGAVTGGWDTELAVMLKAGDEGVFSVIAKFDATDGRNFRFFTDADWTAGYGGYDVFETYPGDLLEPASEDDDPNFNFVGADGWYTIVADVINGTLTMTPSDAPELYLTGDGTHGWNWDEPLSTVYGVSNFVYEGDIDFIQGGTFRVFEQKDWGPVSYGYDVLVNYDTSIIDIRADHADPNWEFFGETGTYHVKINMKDLSVEITQ